MLRLCVAFMLALGPSLACERQSPEAAAPVEPPRHIVLVVVDTLRSDFLSPYRSRRAETPNIAALAARGQVFPNMVASYHQTSMSMGAMFTGRIPSIESGDPREVVAWNSLTWCGLARFGNGSPDQSCIPASVPTLGEALRDAGWWTIGVVSNQFLYDPSGFSRGFEDWTEVDDRNAATGRDAREGMSAPVTARYAENVNRQVAAALGRAPEGRSLFLYVHYIDVHDWSMLRRSYGESVEIVDAALGELLSELEERGVLEHATVVLTSDHGERLGEDHGHPGEFPHPYGHYGNPSFGEVLRVPLIVAPPFFEDTDRMLRTRDLFHLVQEIAGIETRRATDLRRGENYVGEAHYRTYRQGRWKVTFRRSDGKAFLFDLMKDSYEQVNIAEKKQLKVAAYRDRVNQLTRELVTASPERTELTEDDRERLRALGYLEDEPDREPEPERGGE